MARKTLLRDAGTVVVLEHKSQVLRDNPLGDPSLRKPRHTASVPRPT